LIRTDLNFNSNLESATKQHIKKERHKILGIETNYIQRDPNKETSEEYVRTKVNSNIEKELKLK